MFKLKQQKKGSILILIVVFTGIFLVIITGLLGVVYYQQKLNNYLIAKVQAIHIAEAGINYYRWHLAHDPNDYTDGTGLPGPYIHDYRDLTTDLYGKFSLEIDPPGLGSKTVVIRSTGWTEKYPQLKKTIEVRYGRQSLARYSYLTNADVWLRENNSVTGEMHANGGIRMDGINDSLITSAKQAYICTLLHECNNEEKPGIWGTGPNNDLWDYPVPEVDFNTLGINLLTLKNEAQSNGHYHSGKDYGFSIVFKNNGTYDLYKVTELSTSLYQIDDDNLTDWEHKSEQISKRNFQGNQNLPANGLIFIEDNVWIEGIVNGRVTVVSAKFPDNPLINTSIYINDNLTYLNRDGNHVLGLIAQKNIQIPRHAPTNTYIDAVMLALKGRVYRGMYNIGHNSVKNFLEIYGGIISNKTWVWSWGDAYNIVDGYEQTNSIYDSKLIFLPPPYFPSTGDWAYITWEELSN